MREFSLGVVIFLFSSLCQHCSEYKEAASAQSKLTPPQLMRKAQIKASVVYHIAKLASWSGKARSGEKSKEVQERQLCISPTLSFFEQVQQDLADQKAALKDLSIMSYLDSSKLNNCDILVTKRLSQDEFTSSHVNKVITVLELDDLSSKISGALFYLIEENNKLRVYADMERIKSCGIVMEEPLASLVRSMQN